MARILNWRAAVVAGYAGWTLACTFAFGGGWDALIFLGVWGAVWFAFSLWWAWADRTRSVLLRKRGYY
jgi:hypothetical protein